MDLYLGTSSWTAPSWQGVFYPPRTPANRFLTEYSRHFRTVEIDATFYSTPAAGTVDGWHARTPAGFLFAAKVPQVITHEKVLVECEAEIRSHAGEVLATARGKLLQGRPLREEEPR